MNKFLPLIPNLPRGVPLVKADGHMHDHWYNFFTQFIDVLQNTLSNEGHKMPQQTAANIATLSNSNSTSAIVYDSDNKLFKGCIDGIFKTFTTS